MFLKRNGFFSKWVKTKRDSVIKQAEIVGDRKVMERESFTEIKCLLYEKHLLKAKERMSRQKLRKEKRNCFNSGKITLRVVWKKINDL